jgi:hypothetical protein
MIAARLVLAVCLLMLLPGSGLAQSGPRIVAVDPPAGRVETLDRISVTFSAPVNGVRAADFLVNGVPATSVSSSGTTHHFFFKQPPFGMATVTWGPLHAIQDLGQPPTRFDASVADANWSYELVDPRPPELISVLPAPGVALKRLSEVQVVFHRPVVGVDAADLRMNGAPAIDLEGLGAGPYRFRFNAAAPGRVELSWAPDAGIRTDDAAALPFASEGWWYPVDPKAPDRRVIIREILAENLSGLKDEDADPEDWIELFNAGDTEVDLGGWSLGDDPDRPDGWVFPNLVLPPLGSTLLWASGKDRTNQPSSRYLHTDFKLNANGGSLVLSGPELPRTAVDRLDFTRQAPNHSYGLSGPESNRVFRYFAVPTPGKANGASSLTQAVPDLHFSVPRGYFAAPFSLSIASSQAGVTIRYTTNGSIPTLTNGITYTQPIPIQAHRVIRAAGFASNHIPSRVQTHTYLYNLSTSRRLLPAISLVTATNHLYGRSGIMEFNPRNTLNHGIAWERPVSVEWLRPEDNGGFQVDAGIRVAGGDYIRGLYAYNTTALPQSKYSFRLYFRGEYGEGRLRYPVFPGTTVSEFDTLHLRAGMNDHSNPLLKDEFVRTLCDQVGIVASHGTFVHLFLNGVYRGIYNPAERVNEDFLQAYHGGGPLWDVIGVANVALGGDSIAWTALRTAARKDLTQRTNYLDVAARMDLTNFIDYLLPHIWSDNDDWPHNNTRAARERVAGSRFRFYPWDAEFSFGSHSVTYDTIANTLSSTSPPWGTTDYQQLFNALKRSPEFRLLFADRVHRAFFNNGPLTDERIRVTYNALRTRLASSISGYNDVITPWINGRRQHVTNAFQKAGFLASSNAPVLNVFGGRVVAGTRLTMTRRTGTIWYTTNGVDPRVPFTSEVSPQARRYADALSIQPPLRILARTLNGTNWSALVSAEFQPAAQPVTVAISEIQYHPIGGEAYEYLELWNWGSLPVDLSGHQFTGIDFRFPLPSAPIPPGGRIVLANGAKPELFQQRHPNVAVAGWFDGALNNGGERIELKDPAGRGVTSVEYGDSPRWPRAADGRGASLEFRDPLQDPDDPSAWNASVAGGTPGTTPAPLPSPVVRIHEVMATGSPDWVELHNPGDATVDLGGFSLTDNDDPARFVIPAGTKIGPGGFRVFQNLDATTGGADRLTFPLDADGETLVLVSPTGERVDAARYGAMVPEFSLGRDGAGAWVLSRPTPGSANQPLAATELSGALTLNELQVLPFQGSPWIELHNPDPRPAALMGWSLATSNAVARLSEPAFVAPGGFLVLRADRGNGPGHLELDLANTAGHVALQDPQGTEVQRVTYTPPVRGGTLARIPDGTGAIQTLAAIGTPGLSNRVTAWGQSLRITAFTARSTADWVDLENVSKEPIPRKGLRCVIDPPDLPPVTVALDAATSWGPGERIRVHCGGPPPVTTDPLRMVFTATPLPDDAGSLRIEDADGRVLDRVDHGPQVPHRVTFRNGDVWALALETPDRPPPFTPAPLADGSAIRINEWMATGDSDAEFVELHHADPLPADISRWVLTDDPSVRGATNRALPTPSFIGGRGFIRFRLEGSPSQAPGTPLAFRLDALGETLRLVAGYGGVIDTVDYTVQEAGVSEGFFPDGSTNRARFPGRASPGLPNASPDPDSDGDGIPDRWESTHGLRTDLASDAMEDPDGDGASNLAEYLSGTDPRNGLSCFRLKVVHDAITGWFLRFTAEPGRTYLLQASDSLGSPWKRTQEFTGGSVPREVLFSLPLDGDQRCYRVIIP